VRLDARTEFKILERLLKGLEAGRAALAKGGSILAFQIVITLSPTLREFFSHSHIESLTPNYLIRRRGATTIYGPCANQPNRLYF